jgi:DNA polymerase-4
MMARRCDAEVQKSLGHSHVLAPEFRTPEGAWAVAHKLLHKAAMRLRMEQFYAGVDGGDDPLCADAGAGGRVKTKKHFSGLRHSGWGMEARFRAVPGHADAAGVLRGVWAKRPEGAEFARPFFVGVTMHNLIPESEFQESLFGDEDNRAELRRPWTS